MPAESSDLRPLLEELLARSAFNSLEGTSETLQPAVRMAAEALASMRREQPGDRIGPWRLQRMLAEGGMGMVWMAERADGVMQRIAALKLPHAEWIDRGLSERIARERVDTGAIATPEHRCALRRWGHGRRAALPRARVRRRQPIDDYWPPEQLDFEALLRLFVQVVRAVAVRAFKPRHSSRLEAKQCLVTAEGAPKLLDFGISKLLEGDTPTTEETALTRLVGRPLTLSYAAPEQILGLPISVAADIYAFGVMLYELLSGARPYQCDRQPTCT